MDTYTNKSNTLGTSIIKNQVVNHLYQSFCKTRRLKQSEVVEVMEHCNDYNNLG